MTPNSADFTLNEGEPVFILLETDLQPNIENANNVLMVIRNKNLNISSVKLRKLLNHFKLMLISIRNKKITFLQIEHFGRPLAWKVDSRFAVLLHSDLDHFTELVMRSFMQRNLTINDNLSLTRIECKVDHFCERMFRVNLNFLPLSAVSIEGEPQPFEAIKSHSRKDIVNRVMRRLSTEQWDKYLAGLCNLNILASQASEYEYNKNRTEGKTGIVKPDLIPSKSDSSPRRLTSPNDAGASTSTMRKPSPKPSPRTSPLKLIPEVSLEKTESPPPPPLATVEPENVPDAVDLTRELTTSAANLAEPINEKTITRELINSERAEAVEKTPSQPAAAEKTTQPVVSSRHNGTARPTLVRSKGSLLACKPPNVIVYSDSLATRDSVITMLATILEPDMYTIYPLTPQQVKTKIWIDNTTLLVVCGYVAPDIGEILTEYFLRGGKMLSLCSDVLHIVLPSFRTHAEVREHELVQFSYGRWQRVRMMHHIFCYQPSPVRKHFSTDSDEPQPSRKP